MNTFLINIGIYTYTYEYIYMNIYIYVYIIYIFTYIYIYIERERERGRERNGDELVKEDSVTKNSRNDLSKKTTHGSKMLPNVKKQIKNISIYWHSIPQSCFFMRLIFVTFETGLVN